MKIAIDGGAVCGLENHRFGNYTFTKNLLLALSAYNRTHDYCVYSFCPAPDWILKCALGYIQLLPKTAWMSIRVGIEETIEKSDAFLAVNQAIPVIHVNNPIIFSHGLSFLHFPELYFENYLYLKKQADIMAKKANAIIVSSERVRKEWITHYPNIKNVYTLPFGIPFDMEENTEDRQREKFLLFVAMNHPIKNVKVLIDSFHELVKQDRFKEFKLKLVGNFNRYKRERQVEVLTTINRRELRDLYQKATAYMAPSNYESFNYPVLEAISQGCPVIGMDSAIIPEMKKYCHLISDSHELVRAMEDVITGKLTTKIDKQQLKSEFSWTSYVAGLEKIINQLFCNI